MTTTWRLKQLQEWIKTNRPDDDQTADLPKSLSRSAFIVKYHARLARDAFAEFKQPDGSHDKMFVAMMSFEPKFSMAALAHEANIIATIHTVRNYADIFSQLVNSLVMKAPMLEKDCTFGKVAKDIPESALKQGMLDLNSSYWFRYLAAFSNISKHRRLIQSKPSVNFEENMSGLKVEVFSFQLSYKEPETDFSQCWGHDLLEETYNVYRQILMLGQKLNNQIIQ
ncbi:hypothetical protein [Pseudomonas sp. 18058]|uniref:hypothetical protein n=1 Tax=Pseudomonas sp. 18058 TaxID=2681406 RepID=UPI001357928B|nr:hypothetical protein [Pseudomonas sp. 18058]